MRSLRPRSSFVFREPQSHPRSRSALAASLIALACALAMLTGCDSGPKLEDVRALHATGRFEDSIDPLRELLDAAPEDPETNYLYGVALNRTTSSPVAVWSLRKAAEDPGWKVPALLELSGASIRSGNFDAAIESTTQILEEQPDHIAALTMRGGAYLSETEKADLALEDFETILDIDPKNVNARASRAAALLILGEVEEAEKTIAEIDDSAREAEALGSTRAMLCATRAVLLAEKRALAAAEEKFETCLEEFPNDPILLEQAVAFYDQIRKPARANELLETALEAAPGNVAHRRALAGRAIQAGDEARAEALLRAGAELPDPRTRSAALIDLTNFYLERDRLEPAIEVYTKAMELTPQPSQLALLTQADLLARAERHEEALAIARSLERAEYRGLIEARVHLNELRPAEALAQLEKVFAIWPNNAGARYYAGRAAEQLGDFTRAIEEYRQSVRSAPEQTDAGLRMALLYLEAGQLQNAWNSAAQYFRGHPEDPDAVRVLLRAAAGANKQSVQVLSNRLRETPLWPTALAIRAGVVESRLGPEAALEVISEADGLALDAPENVELLRAKVRLQLATGKASAAQKAVEAALAAHPDFAPFHEIRGLVAESVEPAAAEAWHQRAVELAPDNWLALESLGRIKEASGAYDEALALYRRALEVDLEQRSVGRHIARALEAAGRPAEAEKAWEAHLREHPWDGQAALVLARRRLDDGRLDDRTLELAERAILFQAGPEAQPLLVETHRSRGETQRADDVAQAIKDGRPLPPLQVTPID